MRKMKRKAAFGLALLGIAVLGLAVHAGSVATERLSEGTEPVATKVTIDNFSFSPQEITVVPGTTITWVNHDDVPHTVVSNDKRFKSKALDTDDSFSFTFKDAGTYEYYCSLHPRMTAKVTVK